MNDSDRLWPDNRIRRAIAGRFTLTEESMFFACAELRDDYEKVCAELRQQIAELEFKLADLNE